MGDAYIVAKKNELISLWLVSLIFAIIVFAGPILWEYSSATGAHSRLSVIMFVFTWGSIDTAIRILPYAAISSCAAALLKKFGRLSAKNCIAIFTISFALSSLLLKIFEIRKIPSITELIASIGMLILTLITFLWSYRKITLSELPHTITQIIRTTWLWSAASYVFLFFIMEFFVFDWASNSHIGIFKSILLFFAYILYAIVWSIPYIFISLLFLYLVRLLACFAKGFALWITCILLFLLPSLLIYGCNIFLFEGNPIYTLNEDSLANERIFLYVFIPLYILGALAYLKKKFKHFK